MASAGRTSTWRNPSATEPRRTPSQPPPASPKKGTPFGRRGGAKAASLRINANTTPAPDVAVAVALVFAFDIRAPCASVRAGRKGPQGHRHGRRCLFARAGSPVEKPGQPSRTRRATSGVGLSLGYFSLATQRKVTRTPEGVRNTPQATTRDNTPHRHAATPVATPITKPQQATPPNSGSASLRHSPSLSAISS